MLVSVFREHETLPEQGADFGSELRVEGENGVVADTFGETEELGYPQTVVDECPCILDKYTVVVRADNNGLGAYN